MKLRFPYGCAYFTTHLVLASRQVLLGHLALNFRAPLSRTRIPPGAVGEPVVVLLEVLSWGQLEDD